ncbi:MAG: Maf family protein [Candidatus Bipolaricaulia bacterium]
MTLILASASPRRKELLSRITSDFIVVPSLGDEPTDGPPRERALSSARAKAHDVSERHSGVIIGADTVVVLEGDVFVKPESRSDARRMLERLRGREHVVITGLCVVSTWSGEERTAVEETHVRFRELSAEEIADYLATGEGDDKAGAYGIQGRAALLIDHIRGDVYNVMGLPLCRLVLLLREVGVRV